MFADTIDIVGANGYVGSGLCEFFNSKNVKFRKITKLPNEDSCISFENWSNTLSSNICLYLADPSHIDENDYLKYRLATERFDKTLKCTNKLFIYISSSKIYLEQFKGKFSQNDKKSNFSYYQKLKNRNEKRLVEQSNKNYLILRIPSFVDEIPKPYSLFNKIKISNESGRILLSKDYSFNQEFLFGQDFYNVLLKILLNPKIK